MAHIFLSSRKKFFSVNGQKSGASLVTCSIPQGSFLGPLLFMIELKDFHKCSDFFGTSIKTGDTNVMLASNNADYLITNTDKEVKYLPNGQE